MNSDDRQLGFRKAYVYKPGSVGGITPADQVEPAVIEIVQRWNSIIPKNHVRILTTERFTLVRTALAKYHLAEILSAVDFYSRQAWQRRKGAWKTFDKFFGDDVLLQWIEGAIEATEKTENRKPPVDPRVRKLQQQIFDKQADMDKWDALQKQFEGLPPNRRREMLRQAEGELRHLCGPQTNIGPRRRLRHALVILERENKTK